MLRSKCSARAPDPIYCANEQPTSSYIPFFLSKCEYKSQFSIIKPHFIPQALAVPAASVLSDFCLLEIHESKLMCAVQRGNSDNLSCSSSVERASRARLELICRWFPSSRTPGNVHCLFSLNVQPFTCNLMLLFWQFTRSRAMQRSHTCNGSLG